MTVEKNITDYTTDDFLKKVSRTFALVIPMFNGKMQEYTKNAYLIARMLDSYEDNHFSHSRVKSLETKSNLMYLTINSLIDKGHRHNLKAYLTSEIVSEIDNTYEGELVKQHEKVFNEFDTFPMAIQESIVNRLGEMSDGMMKYQKNKIDTMDDLEDYCYYVASTVGLLLNDFAEYQLLTDNYKFVDEKMNGNARSSDEDAVHFGKFLQYVNIIKDYKFDLKEGRVFWPSAFEMVDPARCTLENVLDFNGHALNKMIESAYSHRSSAFNYIKNVSTPLNGYKNGILFAAKAADATLKLTRNNPKIFIGNEKVSISKLEVLSLYVRAKYFF